MVFLQLKKQLGVDSYINKGSFNNHVDIILLFFDHPPTSVDSFYVVNMDKNDNYWTTYPPPLVHVVFECPLGKSRKKKF